jgi:hypothetical protein
MESLTMEKIINTSTMISIDSICRAGYLCPATYTNELMNRRVKKKENWIPAFAGMTIEVSS